MRNKPLAYFITFTTYGTWLHGDSRSSVVVVDHSTKVIEPSEELCRSVRSQLKHPVVVLNERQRKVVLETIQRHCCLKEWHLIAVHVRTNHVHFVIQSDVTIEKVMKDIKAWCTRRLRESGMNVEKVWTRHGSTKFIFTREKLLEKIHYVVFEQGEPMACYLDEEFQERWII